MGIKVENKENILQIFFLCVICVISACLLEIVFNIKLLAISEKDKGNQIIAADSIELDGPEIKNGVIEVKAGDKITLKLDDRYVDKLYYSFEQYSTTIYTDVEIEYLSDLGEIFQIEYTDSCSKYLSESYISLGKKISNITLTFNLPTTETNNHLFLTEIGIKNTFSWNFKRMIFVGLTVFAIGLMWIYRKHFANKIENAFIVIALVIGTAIIVILPPNTYCWDEPIHFRNVLMFSNYPDCLQLSNEIGDILLTNYEASIYTDSYEESESYTQHMDQYALFDSSEYVEESACAKHYITGYLGQFIFVKIGLLLNLPFSIVFAMGRFGNLLFYSLMMFFAIKIIPVGKRILFTIGLIPTSMFLACSFTYDPAVTSGISLGLAIILKWIFDKDSKVTWKMYFICIFALIYGFLPKAVYAPLALTGLLIPNERFENKKQCIAMKVGFVLLLILMMASYVLPTLLNPPATGDPRGGDTNEASQMSLVINHPFIYSGILLRNILQTMPSYLFGGEILAYLGYLGISSLSLIVTVFYVCVLWEECTNAEIKLKMQSKLFLMILVILCVVMIWSALYLSFNIPGTETIEGVQARYYIPLVLPLFFVFCKKNDKPKNRNLKYEVIANIGTIFILFLCFFELVIQVLWK